MKSNYTKDGKYLAVINQNGLWIRDKIENKILIVNASKVDKNFLINSFITEFNTNYEVIRNIKSERIDIKDNTWIVNDAEIFEKNVRTIKDKILINSNFNYDRINSLFSNLSSLSLFELMRFKEKLSVIKLLYGRY